MSKPTSIFRCPSCHFDLLEGDIKHEDYLAISNCCDEVCERVWLCTECGVGEQHKGADECMSCILDAVIADPRELEQCTTELQAEIARGLAERLRPWLRSKQAA